MSSVYKAKKILPDIWRIRNCDVNMYLIVGKEKCLLFDTGFGFGDLKPVIEKICDKPLVVVCSHGHYDHIGGADQFEKVYLPEKDLEPALRHSSAAFRKEALAKAREVKRRPFEKVLLQDFDEIRFLNRPLPEFVSAKEGDVFDLGGTKLEVIELPGHRQGSIALYEKEKKILLVSDAINGYLFLFLKESTPLSVYRDTLYKADQIPFVYMLQDHSKRIYPHKVMKDYIAVAQDPDWEKGNYERIH